MPRHQYLGDDLLKLEIAAPQGFTFALGDTIVGRLVRKTPIDTPEAVVQLSLMGRTKVKIVYRTAQSRTVLRDNWALLSHQSVIFKGPLNLAEHDSPLTWPVNVTIPFAPDPSCRQSHISRCSLLPLDRDHPGHHILPGSFSFNDESVLLYPRATCFVEYYLHAKMVSAHGDRLQTQEALHPIQIRQPIADSSHFYVPRMLQETGSITSQRLLPGMENADLSFKQHMQKVFSSSKVPSFKYGVRLTVPTAIQIHDRTPILLQLEVVPIADGTSQNLQYTAVNVNIMNVQMILRSRTLCIAPGNLLGGEHSNSSETKSNLNLDRLFTGADPPVTLAAGGSHESIHIGNTYQLTLDPRGLKSGNQRLETVPQIWPDFETYNIRHTHSMMWRIYLSIAGEKKEHQFTTPIYIISI
ncbi:hypothetical protein N7492_002717 [Penicillium capsulatum]|uniref:Arrestin-like N-terminal domain-containing protein n=1 Tax=Penicillium capsulatum TaxID=69766 RepID=A0A9W9IKJ3_9EURO|nr:hypothetical protein N7492_002717 [Penicillium capsulatum]KAJ6122686.1 hypothetical protein N7512_005151 [Penicillium capsulatum]